LKTSLDLRLFRLVLPVIFTLVWSSCRPGPAVTEPPPSALPEASSTASGAGSTATTAASAGTATATTPPSSTPAAEPTQTPEVTSTQVATPIPTETPLPQLTAVVVRNYAPVYAGPAQVFNPIVILTSGLAVNVTGRDEPGSWFFVDLLLGQGGWMPANSIAIDGDIETLQILETPEIPTPTATPGSPPVIFVANLETLILQNFKLHENVVITIVQVGNPESMMSRNCVISDPGGTACPTFNLNRIGVEYRISAQGDQGSFAETLFTRAE
jgi:hypothetical protein